MVRPLKLNHDSQAPNPRRVRIFAAEKAIELALEEIDILAGQGRTPEFLAKNSSGAVPVLELDDASHLSEPVAICRYLEGLHPEPNLFGRDLREQAEVERWNRRMDWNCSLLLHARFKTPVRSFKAASSNSRNTAKSSERWFIGVSNGWIAN
jgi:glutathione S-transferase